MYTVYATTCLRRTLLPKLTTLTRLNSITVNRPTSFRSFLSSLTSQNPTSANLATFLSPQCPRKPPCDVRDELGADLLELQVWHVHELGE